MELPEPLRTLSEAARDKLERTEIPDRPEPMLATLTHTAFSDPDWVFERKFDGERCMVFLQDGNVSLMSRNRKIKNDTYPELEDAFAETGLTNGVFDGEIVAFEGNVTSFSRLQNRMQIRDRTEAEKSDTAVYIYLFDVPWLDGWSLEALPLIERKKVLKAAFSFHDPIRYTEHRRENGEAFHREACRKGWEGLIAKERQSRYVHSRSKQWLKLKCVQRQEFVIVGYTDPEGDRIGFGALLLGYYEGEDLRYAGKVGTGYEERFLAEFGEELKKIERKTPPVDEPDDERPTKNVHWVRPVYVGEVGFTEWTGDNKLRHPRFLGLRDDKAPENVRKEE
ncbi:ATP-dependent DNA ligase [bacterium]|nr:ATP-dependent DNA ligase [bacterium]